MLIILDENFNVIETSDAAINQGDAALGRITPRYPLINAISATDNTKPFTRLIRPRRFFL